jgi:hypothetical protein
MPLHRMAMIAAVMLCAAVLHGRAFAQGQARPIRASTRRPVPRRHASSSWRPASASEETHNATSHPPSAFRLLSPARSRC